MTEAAGMEGAPAGDAGSGRIGRIPVRNLWLLMLYASDLARWNGPFQGATEQDLDDIPDLVARLLADAVERRLRRSLSGGYVQRDRRLSRVRGRIDLLRTEAQQLLTRGQVHCRFEEPTLDTPRNRLVRAALDRLARLVSGPDLARRCRLLAVGLGRAGVGGLRPSRAELAADQIGRNDDGDRLMVALARLAFDLALLTEEAGTTAMVSPDRDERRVRSLFEKAVLGFARLELTPQGWSVRGGTPLSWPVADMSEGMGAILPGMRLDILLDAPGGRRLVIDTKFAAILRSGRFGQDRLSNGHLYQIYAYLRSQEERSPAWKTAAGLLLHPAVGATPHEWAAIQGHAIHAAAIDLTLSTADVRRALRRTILTAIGDGDGAGQDG
ncbi:5-methylcytosine-specific restriction endonuclease system specificity protein McrC [Azospirillum humicireducens]|uniref:5-methylcytosine-specific restriction endonuclease system specificity protein McrC n=1 Tax=Azospirillum humicireducens TaxID=1226968 RepID=A0A160JII1_9PROT|nr:5-methylcytosine-specific restriction endonuclease system specificity protein McrC [Azospirillum humicireducens]ANC92923.1 5-methylcytosine-specific restriction endonuclease system specificity protein McrC [Azospirillum humicireducens]